MRTGSAAAVFNDVANDRLSLSEGADRLLEVRRGNSRKVSVVLQLLPVLLGAAFLPIRQPSDIGE